MARNSKKSASKRVALKPADPFDLIRLLARSQSDPRKAVAELVQNSLDAGARRVEIAWANEGGARTLRIVDDGRGVFPDLPREDALRRIATTIGHSHKRSLTPEQRQREMALGKYGIGLLGFWSVGRHMEIRSRVAGSEALVLRLEEDRASGEIARSRARRLDEHETSTEVLIRGVHDVAARQIKPGRLQAYLAAELRGQLLGREDVEIHIHDRVSRGSAHKHFVVRPPRYLGRHLPEFRTLAIEGFEDARLELYLVPAEDDRRGVVQLTCGGSTVLDDLAAVAPEEGPRPPWDSGRLEGFVDFPDLEVSPSTRRGFVPDAAAAALLGALPRIEITLAAVISEDEVAHAAQKSKTVASEIRRAFRRVALLPEYELVPVRAAATSAGADRVAEGPARPGARLESGEGEGSDSEPARAGAVLPEAAMPHEPTGSIKPERASPTTEDDRLFPPGPVARLRVTPPRLRVAPGAQRTLRAVALDGDGRAADPGFEWSWRLEGPGELVWQATRRASPPPSSPARRGSSCAPRALAIPPKRRSRSKCSPNSPGPSAPPGSPSPPPCTRRRKRGAHASSARRGSSTRGTGTTWRSRASRRAGCATSCTSSRRRSYRRTSERPATRTCWSGWSRC